MDLDKIRHSTSHVLADAIKSLYPKAKPTLGPAIEDGFYYDFYNLKIEEKDLKKIEKKMKEIIKNNSKFKQVKKTRKEAEKFYKENKFKREILKDIKGKNINFYQHGDFLDLCKGNHSKSTGDIKAFKLLKIAGSYWRGDAKKEQLTRIYGTAFPSKNELNNYLKLLQEAEKRDHRKIGKQLDLFSFNELSPGSIFFHPKGAFIYNELINFMREEYKKRGFQEVITPALYEKSLWETSGHWKHFQNDMFVLKIDGREFALKPMNCPSHCIIYKNTLRSYRDLPIRLADFTPLHRNELKGVLGGLTRVRKFQQDDSHSFVTPEQLNKEIIDLIDFTIYIYQKVFDFEVEVSLSTRPDKAMGDKKLWTTAEKALEKSLKKKKIKFELKKGEGAFYGPKIDFDIKDSLGRNWQLATIQLDFQMPQRFKLTYEGKDGKKHVPIIIHKAIYGSLERFMAVLIEHYYGNFPLWLSPLQVVLLTVNDKCLKFAEEVKNKLEENNIRVEIDDRSESVPKKVRDAEVKKINLIVTIGEKEVKNNTLAVRDSNGKVQFGVKVDSFIKQIVSDVKNKKI